MQGGGRSMKSGSMYGGGGMNNSNSGWNGPQHAIHMRGLPFRATQADIADVSRCHIAYLVNVFKRIHCPFSNIL